MNPIDNNRMDVQTTSQLVIVRHQVVLGFTVPRVRAVPVAHANALSESYWSACSGLRVYRFGSACSRLRVYGESDNTKVALVIGHHKGVGERAMVVCAHPHRPPPPRVHLRVRVP
jgi:hypothetical protein